jgi:hypothetical protein
VGDRVLSSTEEGEVSYQAVTRIFQRNDVEEVSLTFTDAHGAGAPIVTTPEHPFRVASGEWVVAGRLDIGDNVVTAEGGLATLSAALSLEKSGTVYNFEVEGTHTYFVGEAKLWVHNACNPKAGVRAAQRSDGGIEKGRPLSDREAINRLQGGQDVYTPSKGEAKALQKKAGSGSPVHDDAHGPGYYSHYHNNGRTGGHAFYGDPDD